MRRTVDTLTPRQRATSERVKYRLEFSNSAGSLCNGITGEVDERLFDMGSGRVRDRDNDKVTDRGLTGQ
jgi:hypothetical protein